MNSDRYLDDRTGVLVLDMLNDFVLPSAPLAVPGATELAARIAAFLERARASGATVVYACDRHAPDDPEFAHWPAHAVRDTPGSEVVEQLQPEPADLLVAKQHYDAFLETDLDQKLSQHNVARVILTGLVTEVCVLLTGLTAGQLGYQVVVPQGLVIGLSEDDHSWALRHIQRLVGAEVV
ncbi:MAG: cysteine hydrolase family protein [Candidatus Bipolaricaulaceae bacterium]